MTGLLTRLRFILVGLLPSLLLLPSVSQAEPYLALQMGFKCAVCHVNPTGGGLRTPFGDTFSQRLLPAKQLPDQLEGWTGNIGDRLRLGADYRTATTQTNVPDTPSMRQSGIEQFRVYGDLQLISDRLGAYVDEQLDPGKPTREEAYIRLSTPGMGWYAKAGQFYLPFGWRLQDNTAFVREVSGISMTDPDKGLEIGHEGDNISAQLVYSDGPGNKGTGGGHMVTAQLVWLLTWGRLGIADAMTNSRLGDRQVSGLFAGTRTGPVAWLAEIDVVHDASFPGSERAMVASLFEMDWKVMQGHNLKLTDEIYDPDRSVPHDRQVRQSLVYEYTPIPFVQLRGGYRHYLGIPQSAVDNRELCFVELHGFF